jgi:hypothetical protein
MDWQGTPDDPHGYLKLRSFMAAAAERVDAVGHPDAAKRLRVAGSWVGLPSEWMGESALALKAALALDDLPPDLAAELEDALSAIRTGFSRVGHIPNF